jgi:hypothetical protein
MSTTVPGPTAAALAEALGPLTKAHLLALAEREVRRQHAYGRRGIDYDGLTSAHVPIVMPALLGFRTPQGEWIVGQTEPKIDPNHFRVELCVQAYAPCRYVAHRGTICGCRKRLTGIRSGPANLLTNGFAGLVRAGILGTTTSVTDTTPTARSITNAINGGINAAVTAIVAGTGATAATVADTNLQTQTETVVAGAPSAISGSGATGTMTIAGTVTAGADRAYTECGIKVTSTTNSWVFLIARDTFSTLNVSSTGTLAITYSITNS